MLLFAVLPHFKLPAEDVVILFQYSRNLAQHGAITYMPGGGHIEGATDFLWMLLVSGAIRLGLSPFAFCAIANVLCLLGIAVLILKLGNLPRTLMHILAVVGMASMLPQIFAAASGFAILPDALLLVSLVWATLRRRVVLSGLFALALSLFRPDGVLFAVPMLVYVVLLRRDSNCSQRRPVLKDIATVSLTYVLPGLLYFLWRAHYFHELLPIPFLVKSDAERVLGPFVFRSVRESLVYLILVLVVLGLLLRTEVLDRAQRTRNRWLVVALIVLPTLFYWSVRLDQNVAKRFFYYLPLSLAILVSINLPASPRARRVLLSAGLMVWLLLLLKPFMRELQVYRDTQFTGIKALAQDLGRQPLRGTILSTEAGMIPYFSGWETTDAWGLNTPRFAHHLISPADVSQLSADVVVLHPDLDESCLVSPSWPAAGLHDSHLATPHPQPLDRDWERVRTLARLLWLRDVSAPDALALRRGRSRVLARKAELAASLRDRGGARAQSRRRPCRCKRPGRTALRHALP